CGGRDRTRCRLSGRAFARLGDDVQLSCGPAYDGFAMKTLNCGFASALLLGAAAPGHAQSPGSAEEFYTNRSGSTLDGCSSGARCRVSSENTHPAGQPWCRRT